MPKALWLTELKVATAWLLALGAFAAGLLACQTPAAAPEARGEPYLEQGAGPAAAPVSREAARQDDDRQDEKDDPEDESKDVGRKKQKDDDDDGPKYQGFAKALDVLGSTLTLTVRRNGKDVDHTFNLARNVRVQVAGKSAPLARVKAGMQIALKLSGDKKAVVEIKEVKGQPDREDDRKGKKATGKNRGGS